MKTPFARTATAALLAALLAACASAPPEPAMSPSAFVETLAPADVLMLGDPDDTPDTQRFHRGVIEALAAQGRLGAVVMERIERGLSTWGLPPAAPEDEVLERLRWTADDTRWAAIGPVVMAAVRAGVPVVGGGVEPVVTGLAVGDSMLDRRLDDTARAERAERIRAAPCGQVAEALIAGEVRSQIARDLSLAATIESTRRARKDGKPIVLIAGNDPVDRRLGVPRHLPPATRVVTVGVLADAARGEPQAQAMPGYDRLWHTPRRTAQVACAEPHAPD